MINDMKRGPLANGIALHDFKATTCDFKKYLDTVETFFREYGVEPNKIDGARSIISYSRGKNKISKEGFRCPKTIWIGANTVVTGTDMFDWLFTSYFDFSSKFSFFHLGFDNSLCPYNTSVVLGLVQTFSEFFKPQYGYFYQRSFKKGPGFYPFGTISGLDWDDPEADEITNWRIRCNRENGDYKTGDLRDIYPLNFIGESHFQRDIFGVPLRKWIETSPERGALIPLMSDLWSWEVPEKQIPHVRDALKPTGILLSLNP